jgi:hypothetical protein
LVPQSTGGVANLEGHAIDGGRRVTDKLWEMADMVKVLKLGSNLSVDGALA